MALGSLLRRMTSNGVPVTSRSHKIDQDRSVNSLEELTGLVFSYRKSRDFWMFRGGTEHLRTREQDRKTNLTPKIGRKDARRSLSTSGSRGYRKYLEQEEFELYEHFRRAAIPHVSGRLEALELLALARHHSLPTRLLDWTESLLIAAFFAVAEADPDDVVPVIYAATGIQDAIPNVQRSRLPLDRLQTLNELPDVAMYRPPHVSPRITAQRGAFSVHRVPEVPFSAPKFFTISLRGDNPLTYKMNLHYAGINHATLFPDLDGVAQQLHWQYKWGHLPPQKREQ